MHVLTRQPRQAVKIGDRVTVTILEIRGTQVRLGVDAPRDVSVLRGELSPKARTPRTPDAAA
jgi:carbon storage regulator CsrA